MIVQFFSRFGVKRTRRSLYALLAFLIACVVVPGLGGMIYDRLLKEAPTVDCAAELKAVGATRTVLSNRSMADTELDLTEDWLKLRQRSVVLRRQCKQRKGFERRVVEEDERVRRGLAAHRVQRNL